MSRYPQGSFGFPRQGPVVDYESNVDSMVMGRFFNAVYAWMCAGLAVTALVAWSVANSPDLRAMAQGPAIFLAFIIELGLVFVISGAINRINAAVATSLFMVYSALNGFVLSSLFLRYSVQSLGGTFMITAAAFGVMSLWGYLTKADLTRLGSLLMMALLGLVIASVVNLFIHSSALYWGVSYAGVLIFVGLTAFDTQRLKAVAAQTAGDPRLASRMAVVGSLMLYLDFINLFLLLLRLLNNNRRS